MDLNYFTFGGIRSNEYKTYISGDEEYNIPEEVYTMIAVPGRNGKLAISEGRYENFDVKYPAMIFADSDFDFEKNLTALISDMKAKHGYQRIETTYRPESYRMGIFRSPVEVIPDDAGRVGEFDIVFDCMPQRFLKDGEIEKEYTTSGSILNPTNFASKPLIKVTGTGTVGLGDETITVTGTSSQVIYIDSDIHDAYEYSGSSIVNANGKVSFTSTDFPEIQPGESGITLGSGISKVEITPRWWTI